MRLGFIADAHGNPGGLAACLDRLAGLGVDAVHFLGDAVGYGPEAAAVLDRLRRDGIPCQLGNHEAMLLAGPPAGRDAVYRLADARAGLSAEVLAELAAWPRARELEAGGRRIRLVHGSPADPLRGYLYPDTDLAPLDGLECDVVVCGHTHRPFVRAGAGPLVVNAGSVGLPRDAGSLAAFAVYDTAAGAATIYRVAFDPGPLLDRVHPDVRAVLTRPVGDFVGRRLS
jgi:putative phosphoesterase